MDHTSFGFPFKIGDDGRVASLTGDDNIRGKIIQVLFTSPGERVNMPEFGCGLRDLVFDPNNLILAATTEFTVRKSLERWVGNEILVEAVDVTSEEENLLITIVYIRKDTLEKQAIKITF
ncbi:MAG: GPW/gp25 family protein [Deltaproteobacteria bacterium]|nr:GPW/gp25 family protein [Deltaproteobacteria bacterium]